MSVENGNEAKLYHLSTGSRASWGSANADGYAEGVAPANLSEITNTKDLELDITASEGDVSDRSSIWKKYQATMMDASIEITLLNKKSGAAQTAINAFKKAYINRSTVPLAILDGDAGVAGSEGLWADFAVLGMKRGEPLEDVQTYVFTVKPGESDVPPEWVVTEAAA